MLVVKSCVEILRSCGINILVVFSDIPEFCLDYKLPTTKNVELATEFFWLFYVSERTCCEKNILFFSLNSFFVLLCLTSGVSGTPSRLPMRIAHVFPVCDHLIF